MDNFEIFSGSDKSEGVSEAAFEAFQEKMRKAAAAMAASKKEEGKHKKKEEDLYKILLIFIKNSKNDKLVELISKALELNIPSGFILALIQLGNDEIANQLGVSNKNETSLTFFSEEKDLTPQMRVEMDFWVKTQLSYAEESSVKILKTCRKKDDLKIEEDLIELHKYVIAEYLNKNGVGNTNESLQNFSTFILRGILQKITPKSLKE